MKKALTWKDMYEASKKAPIVKTGEFGQNFSMKEYTGPRTFSEMFDESLPGSGDVRLKECGPMEDIPDDLPKVDVAEALEEGSKSFSEIFEGKPRANRNADTFDTLYEDYQYELEPISEQEAVFLMAKVDSGERLTESEIQRLEEGMGGFSNWQNIRGGLANMFNPQGAYAQAYNQQKKLNKQNKKNLKKNHYMNQFAQGSNEWLERKAGRYNAEQNTPQQVVKPQAPQAQQVQNVGGTLQEVPAPEQAPAPVPAPAAQGQAPTPAPAPAPEAPAPAATPAAPKKNKKATPKPASPNTIQGATPEQQQKIDKIIQKKDSMAQDGNDKGKAAFLQALQGTNGNSNAIQQIIDQNGEVDGQSVDESTRIKSFGEILREAKLIEELIHSYSLCELRETTGTSYDIADSNGNIIEDIPGLRASGINTLGKVISALYYTVFNSPKSNLKGRTDLKIVQITPSGQISDFPPEKVRIANSMFSLGQDAFKEFIKEHHLSDYKEYKQLVDKERPGVAIRQGIKKDGKTQELLKRTGDSHRSRGSLM